MKQSEVLKNPSGFQDKDKLEGVKAGGDNCITMVTWRVVLPGGSEKWSGLGCI